MFFIRIFISLFIIIFFYHILNLKEIGILKIIILLFIFNINIFSFYKEISIIYNLLLSLIVILLYYLYKFLYNINLNNKIKKEEKILINRGIINFHELIKENYSYDNLIFNLKKRGITSPDLVDYCIKYGNELIIFKKNTIKNYPISLIIDGNILKDNLFSINKSLDWLNKRLEENNLNIENINYAYYKNKDVYFITN